MGDHGVVSNKSNRKPPANRGRNPRPQQDNRTPFRKALEKRSAAPLMALNSLPRWVIPVTMGLLLLGGLWLVGPLAWVGAILMIVVALFVLWLTALAWPVLTPGSRVMRVVILAALTGIIILKFQGVM